MYVNDLVLEVGVRVSATVCMLGRDRTLTVTEVLPNIMTASLMSLNI